MEELTLRFSLSWRGRQLLTPHQGFLRKVRLQREIEPGSGSTWGGGISLNANHPFLIESWHYSRSTNDENEGAWRALIPQSTYARSSHFEADMDMQAHRFCKHKFETLEVHRDGGQRFL